MVDFNAVCLWCLAFIEVDVERWEIWELDLAVIDSESRIGLGTSKQES